MLDNIKTHTKTWIHWRQFSHISCTDEQNTKMWCALYVVVQYSNGRGDERFFVYVFPCKWVSVVSSSVKGVWGEFIILLGWLIIRASLVLCLIVRALYQAEILKVSMSCWLGDVPWEATRGLFPSQVSVTIGLQSPSPLLDSLFIITLSCSHSPC